MLTEPRGPMGVVDSDTFARRQNALLRIVRNPYYIVAPRYRRTSAGVKALHFLCHALNRIGERAYLITHPYYMGEYATNPDLLTPLLSNNVLHADFERGLCPITIYPETMSGNLFSAPFVVRYVLNYPGELGGDEKYPEHEFCIAYSETLRRVLPRSRGTLFIPASDEKVFSPQPNVKRQGSCFYAGKYKYFYRGQLFEVTRDSVEILRDGLGAQTPTQIAELFRRSEIFYCYENTALAIEAVLCECPVVFLPNRHFDRVIAVEEHGWDGMAWGTAPEEVDRAIRTVERARSNYLRLYDRFQDQLENFVEMTQEEVRGRQYVEILHVPYLKKPSFVVKFISAIRIYRSLVFERGLLSATCMVVKRIVHRGFTLLP